MTTTTEQLAEVEAERDMLKRGGAELGKTLVFLAELIKDAYVRGADDPIDALHMLGNYLAEVPASEGGLHFDDFSRVYRALEDRRKAEGEVERLRAEVKREQERCNEVGSWLDSTKAKRNELAAEVVRLREENARLRAELGRPLTDNERAFQDGV